VYFERSVYPASVWFYDIQNGSVSMGTDSRPVVNAVSFSGNPISGWFSKMYRRTDSIEEYGERYRSVPVYSVSVVADADKMVANLLDDVSYPTPSGTGTDYDGRLSGMSVGQLVEIRGGGLRRFTRELAEEWGGRYAGRYVFAISSKTILIRNDRVDVTFGLTSPLRSVADPIGFTIRNQPAAERLYEFRLDAESVGLDFAYHID
ncbi:MAG: hypothetical protein J7M12_06890, partial [Candidatus Hydrogenedentes bacterium]|nr:hypothetical protein [Candidatus Hydrogenedentota bacterium]